MTNGTPNNAKKGTPELNAETNQKIANPHQNRLNGIKNMSAVLNTMPFLGCPVQMSFSLESRCP